VDPVEEDGQSAAPTRTPAQTVPPTLGRPDPARESDRGNHRPGDDEAPRRPGDADDQERDRGGADDPRHRAVLQAGECCDPRGGLPVPGARGLHGVAVQCAASRAQQTREARHHDGQQSPATQIRSSFDLADPPVSDGVTTERDDLCCRRGDQPRPVGPPQDVPDGIKARYVGHTDPGAQEQKGGEPDDQAQF
jgi:hypothetical protein